MASLEGWVFRTVSPLVSVTSDEFRASRLP
jgi:hypothetical protein